MRLVHGLDALALGCERAIPEGGVKISKRVIYWREGGGGRIPKGVMLVGDFIPRLDAFEIEGGLWLETGGSASQGLLYPL